MFGELDANGEVENSVKSNGNSCAAAEGNPEEADSGNGKILIELNLSRQNLQNDEISQIIRDILELNNKDFEVEKVVMPVGESTWQILKTNVSENESEAESSTPSTSALDLNNSRRKRRLAQAKVKLIKQSKLFKYKSQPFRPKSRHGSRGKDPNGQDRLDVADLHFSPGITNLLSQLYPNPYNLIGLMDVRDSSRANESRAGSTENCRIQFKGKCDLSGKDSEMDQEIISLESELSAIVTTQNDAAKGKDEPAEAVKKPEHNGRLCRLRAFNLVEDFNVGVDKITPKGQEAVGAEENSGVTGSPAEQVKSNRVQFGKTSQEERFCKIDSNAKAPSDGNFVYYSSVKANESPCGDWSPNARPKKGNDDKVVDKPSDRGLLGVSKEFQMSQLMDDVLRRSKTTSTDTQVMKKRDVKVSTISKGVPVTGRMTFPKKPPINNKTQPVMKSKVSISAIHPMSLQRTVPIADEKEPETERKIGPKVRDILLKKPREDRHPEKGFDVHSGCSHSPYTGGRGRSELRKPPMSEKRKCEIQYLELIKNMFEAEERDLQGKIDDALNFALNQIEKPKRQIPKPKYLRQQPRQKAFDFGQTFGSCKVKDRNEKKVANSQCQTPTKVRKTCKKSTEKTQPDNSKSNETPIADVAKDLEPAPEKPSNMLGASVEEMIGAADEKVQLSMKNAVEGVAMEGLAQTGIAESGPSSYDLGEKVCSVAREVARQTGSCVTPKHSLMPVSNRDEGSVYRGKPDNVCDIFRGDNYLYNKEKLKGEEKNAERLRIEVINRNAQETNRKIDLLISHIDNSMNWLMQSEKTDSSNIGSLIEKAKDLSNKLEQNLRKCKTGGSLTLAKNNESLKPRDGKDLLLGSSYHSLHIFPGIRSFQISTENMTLLEGDLLRSARNKDYLCWQSNLLRPTSLGSIRGCRNRFLNSNRSISYPRRSAVGLNPSEAAVDADGNFPAVRERRQPARAAADRDDGFVSVSHDNASPDSEVPELIMNENPVVISVESSNELGSFAEAAVHPETGSLSGNRNSCESLRNRRKRDNSISILDVKTALDSEEMLLKKNSKDEVAAAERNVPTGDGNGRVIDHPSSWSMGVASLNDHSSPLRRIVVRETTWKTCALVVSPVVYLHYRNEHHRMRTSTEARAVYVAVNAHFLCTALMNIIKMVKHELQQQSSVIISLHKCSSFVKTGSNTEESSKVCKFVVLPSDVNFAQQSSGNMLSDDNPSSDDIKVLKKADSDVTGFRESMMVREISYTHNWDSFPSESSTEMYDGDKPDINKIENLLQRTGKLSIGPEKYSRNLTWLHPVPDPYESNAGDEDGDRGDLRKPGTFHALRTGPNPASPPQESKNESAPGNWDVKKVKFGSLTPHIFRYLSSSNESVEDKIFEATKAGERAWGTSIEAGDGNSLQVKRKSAEAVKAISRTKVPVDNADEQNETSKGGNEGGDDDDDDDDDSTSTSSFKSSNDYSDVSEMTELGYGKKKLKSRSVFLDKIFHELRSFRKSLTKRRGPKRKASAEDKKEPNEFEDALSELNVEAEQSDKAVVPSEPAKVDEAVAVNTMMIDEVAIPIAHSMPRKIFKTSFKGKESVTELMIDLKDMSISEVSDISVEKKKLSTDHTKISIIISKQPNGSGDREACGANRKALPEGGGGGGGRLENKSPFEEDADYCSTDAAGESKEQEDDDDNKSDDEDFKSVGSGSHGRSTENLTEKREGEEDNVATVQATALEPNRYRKYRKHKFDFYKKMERANSSFDAVKSGGVLEPKYDKELEPLKKALTDMKVRMREIQKQTSTGEDYYERALRMAKMSAGYCESCKNKTVIPEDPLGFYRKFFPRGSARNPEGIRRKYYFRTTSSTNSSFYSIHSSNSDISDKFCHLNSSSSIVANSLSRNRGWR